MFYNCGFCYAVISFAWPFQMIALWSCSLLPIMPRLWLMQPALLHLFQMELTWIVAVPKGITYYTDYEHCIMLYNNKTIQAPMAFTHAFVCTVFVFLCSTFSLLPFSYCVFQMGDVSWLRCMPHQQAWACEGHGQTYQKPGRQSKLHGVH